MRVEERRLGRIFRLAFEPGEDFFAGMSAFARERQIREASLFLFGALADGEMITGFRKAEGYDVIRRPLGQWREFLAVGSLAWPASPPEALGDVRWEAPQPYVHLHLALGPAAGAGEDEVLVGHLSKGVVKGLYADVYELL
jgi:predicted DNA-binding protein with PD1-like motif